MSEEKEIITSLLDQLAAEVMVLEPGDLMTYGEVLSRLEQLAIACGGGDQQVLARLAEGLKAHLESMILGQTTDQEKGVELLQEGVSLGQSLMRGDVDEQSADQFLARIGQGGETAAPATAESSQEEAAAPPAAPEGQPEAPPAPAETVEPLSSEDAELMAGFVSEAMEHLESIEVNALLLEDSPEDQEILNAVFRPFHTIKGVSGFLNLGDINHLAHALENLLDQARSGNLIIDSEAVDVILAGVDMLRQMISEAQEAADQGRPRRGFDTSELEARLKAVLEGAGGRQESSAASPEEAEASPEEAAASGEHPPLGEILVDQGAVAPQEVERALEKQQKGVSKRIGEILVQDGAAEPKEVAQGLKLQKKMTGGKTAQQQSVKIDTQKLDNLLDMVGELVIAQSMVEANPHVQAAIGDRKLAADLAQLARITTELQKSTMSMRMVPIKQTFQKMVRVVRDTAKKAGKKVRLELEGETTEIDRNMVEKFYDPLMHMVRNSVDHGIETPQERRAAGKPEEGLVVLSAYHKGGNVCVEIRDDGRGLDREKILAKALENGIIQDTEGISDDEVYHLILKPGFSTAEVVTEISGRGVGMDVVQKAIDELRGKIEIRTEKGKGTTFTIALPLTLAIIDGMVVEVGEDRFILPTVAVAESLRPGREDYSTVQGRGEMIMIRGNLLPLVRLHDIVEVEPKERDPWNALVVVVEHHGSKRCLLVDRLVGRQEVVIKSLGESLKGVKVVAGGAIMGDGRVGLILDVEGVFKAQDGKRA